MVPKPGPHLDQTRRWFQERASEHSWEQDGLDHVKRLMPAAEPFRAWATFSFNAPSGRIHECDLLIATPGGLHLVELKAHPGRVENHGDTWSFHEQGRGWPRTLRNPLHLTDVKSKELKSRLEWATRRRKLKGTVPRVEPAIFLTDPGLVCELDEVQRVRVYGRDEHAENVPWIWRDLLSRPPRSENQRVTPAFSRELPKLLADIGIRAASAHLQFGDGWELAPEPLDLGPAWEDRLASRSRPVKETGRVRIYLTEQQAGEERRAQIERAARREYQVLQGITHRGIAQPVDLRDHQGRPAILFRHDPEDVRLDSFVALHGEHLGPEARLDMVRQLAEAVRYAHGRSLYHRALSARSVYVSSGAQGADPLLRVIDWQTAARDFTSGSTSSIGVSSLADDVVGDSAGPYLAPEFDQPFADPADLDLFGLGAIAYLVLTGQAPATTRPALVERLRTDQGLHVHGLDGTLPQALDALVFTATRADVKDRLQSADAFLRRLDETERVVADVDPPADDVDPLTAAVGQRVDGDWVVERILGTGSTSRALLVARDVDDASEAVERRVLKVALDEQKAESLRAEAAALEVVGGGPIVSKLGGPRAVGERTVVDLQYGGGYDLTGGTLGTLLREEGRLSFHDLERFGRDLFAALDQLTGRGTRHRDIKPDNLAVFRRADRSRQLMLLDFSLAEVPEREVTVGTRGYLDPFLGTPRRPAFDDAAEFYAAAVTLHEMASQQRPEWGDGLTDPRTTTDETPRLAADEFDPALKDGLIAFFRRALHREVDRRFEGLRQMEDAWRDVFVAADRRTPLGAAAEVDDPAALAATRDRLVAAAALDTGLEEAGLSARGVSVAAGFGAATVGELLAVRPHELARARGAGAAVRKELLRRHKQWIPLLRAPARSSDEPTTIEEIVRAATDTGGARRSKRDDVARVTVGLDPSVPPWPNQSQIATALGVRQPTVSRYQQELFERWAESAAVADLRDVIVDALGGAGRVMTVAELAAVVRARYGSAPDEIERTPATASAAVRIAVEAEKWAGEQDNDVGPGPRLAVSRRDDVVLVALEAVDGTDDPNPSELADHARALGRTADELAAAEPLPGRAAVVDRLRAVTVPEGAAPLPETRLVALAAAASTAALPSPRGELYPRGLGLVAALRISQAAAGVRRRDPEARFPTGITLDALLSRVRARFPEVEVPAELGPTGMYEALREAGFRLDYDGTDHRFYPEAPPAPAASSTSTSLPGRVFVRPEGRGSVRRALHRARERGGFVALTVRGRELPGAARAVADAVPVRTIDVNALFLAEFRALATERGQDWTKVLATDATFTATGQLPRGLASYVRVAWERAGARIDEASVPDVVLLLHGAGLLARYAEAGGRQLLVRLQAAARPPETAPHGLWLLCPGESATATPQLDGMIVEKIDGSEQIVLDRAALEELAPVPAGVA